MLRIVPPTGVSTACSNATATGLLRWAVSTPNIVAVAADVRVTVEIVVVVAPAAAPAPTAAPKCPHHHSNAERNRQPGGVVSCRGIVNRRVGVKGCTPNHQGVIRRYINDLWIRLFNNDHTLVLDDFRFHPLLFPRL